MIGNKFIDFLFEALDTSDIKLTSRLIMYEVFLQVEPMDY